MDRSNRNERLGHRPARKPVKGNGHATPNGCREDRMKSILFVLFLLVMPLVFKAVLVVFLGHIALPLAILLTLYFLWQWA